VAARLTRNPQLQEDIFQEVVMRVIRKISEFRGNCKFSTWVSRITVNVTFSMLSREGVHKNALGLDEVAEQLSGGNMGIEDTIDQKRMFKGGGVRHYGHAAEQSRGLFNVLPSRMQALTR